MGGACCSEKSAPSSHFGQRNEADDIVVIPQQANLLPCIEGGCSRSLQIVEPYGVLERVLNRQPSFEGCVDDLHCEMTGLSSMETGFFFDELMSSNSNLASPTKKEALKYSPINAPFLFSDVGRKQRWSFCGNCKSASNALEPLGFSDQPKQSDVEIKYDMWVMPLLTVLELDAMEPHQVLRDKGLILRRRPLMDGRIIFVSHQWLGFESPDPDCVHLRTLQRVLTRLMRGEIPKVCMDFKGKQFHGDDLSIKAEDWAAALPHMYIWLDYFSMPQASVAVQSDSVSSEVIKKSTSGSSDHRYLENCFATTLQDAVSSIPAYVQLSTLMLVLAPICRHHDSSRAADYSTWRARGWCRMELASALLTPRKLPMMLVLGSEQTPFFMRSYDAFLLPPGEGVFSCCAMNHVIGNQAIPCDKVKVCGVMEAIISHKVEQLQIQGRFISKCMLVSLRNMLLRGLPTIQDNSRTPTSVASLKALLAFDKQVAFVDGPPSKIDRLLFQIALQFNSLTIVQELLDSCKFNVNCCGYADHFIGMPELPMLSIVMAWSSPAIVGELLGRRADPTIRVRPGKIMAGLNSFQIAAGLGREDNVRLWLKYHPAWLANVNDHVGVIGVGTIGLAAVGNISPGSSMLSALIDAGADVNHRNHFGATPLFTVSVWPSFTNDSSEFIIKELLANKADVNAKAVPPTRLAKRAYWLCRKTCKVGEPDGKKVSMAIMEGATPLHIAAKKGRLVSVEILLEARADPTLRNTMGLTPLDVAQWMFKDVPRPLFELLS